MFLVLLSVGEFLIHGLTYGIDFRGGTLVQVQFESEPPLAGIREAFQKKIKSAVSATRFGDEAANEVLLTLNQDSVTGYEGKINTFIKEVFEDKFGSYEIRRVETVGPKVGSELKSKAFQAALYALGGILIYIAIRFQVKYGVAAIAALFHDVTITLGIFSLMDKEFTLTIVAALLTTIGYSLNDTIVVFDRVRENVARNPKMGLLSIVNKSVNESLSRTILTSVTTFIVVLAMFVVGGDIIHDFCFAMLIGLVVGTYSSVFVASPVVVALDKQTAK